MGDLILGGLLMVIALGLILLVRNHYVYRFRCDLLRKISATNQAGISRGDYDWERRYEPFDDVSYGRMLWQIWKPFRSFYPDAYLAEVGMG